MHVHIKRTVGVPVSGFTLIELAVVLVILTILAMLATPSLTQLLQTERRRSAEVELTAHLAMARVAAISRGRRVTVLPLDARWSEGWQVFVDENSDAARSGNEELLAVHHAAEGLVVRGTGVLASYAMFGPDGRPTQANGAFLAGTLQICQAGGQGGVRLVMSAAGRIRREDVGDSECTSTSNL